MRKSLARYAKSKADINSDKWNKIADHCNDNFFHIDMERYTLRICIT